ncbi:MAG: fibronectin type III domain-containing protein [Syntrophobacteraceae bacterium]
MIGKAVTIAVLAIFLVTSQSFASGAGVGVGGGGVGGGVGVGTGVGVSPPVDLLMPTPPLNVTATAGNGMATVSFEPPKSDGGDAVTVYTVTSHPGRIKAKSAKSPVTVRGLTNGKAYTFTVTATNSVGTGLASGPSNSVTPGE